MIPLLIWTRIPTDLVLGGIWTIVPYSGLNQATEYCSAAYPFKKQFDSKTSDSIIGCFIFYGGYVAVVSVSVFFISRLCVQCFRSSSLFLCSNENCIRKYKTDQIFVQIITKPKMHIVCSGQKQDTLLFRAKTGQISRGYHQRQLAPIGNDLQ